MCQGAVPAWGAGAGAPNKLLLEAGAATAPNRLVEDAVGAPKRPAEDAAEAPKRLLEAPNVACRGSPSKHTAPNCVK